MEFIFGITTSLVAELIVVIIVYFVKKQQSLKYSLSGKWEQKIYDNDNPDKVIKLDIVECKHFKQDVECTIKRQFPVNENYKSWIFKGKYMDELLIGHFWGINNNSPSYGTIQMFLTDENKNKLEGFYIKSNKSIGNIDGRKIIYKKLIDTTLIWERL